MLQLEVDILSFRAASFQSVHSLPLVNRCQQQLAASNSASKVHRSRYPEQPHRVLRGEDERCTLLCGSTRLTASTNADRAEWMILVQSCKAPMYFC